MSTIPKTLPRTERQEKLNTQETGSEDTMLSLLPPIREEGRSHDKSQTALKLLTPTATHTPLAKASHVFVVNTSTMAPSPTQAGYTSKRLS